MSRYIITSEFDVYSIEKCIVIDITHSSIDFVEELLHLLCGQLFHHYMIFRKIAIIITLRDGMEHIFHTIAIVITLRGGIEHIFRTIAEDI